jgi:hypothetical protein
MFKGYLRQVFHDAVEEKHLFVVSRTDVLLQFIQVLFIECLDLTLVLDNKVHAIGVTFMGRMEHFQKLCAFRDIR